MYHAQNVAFKSIPLNALPESAWTYITGKTPNEDSLSIDTLVKRVPWLFRAESIRAEAIANMPRAYHRGNAGGEEVEYDSVPLKFNADELLNVIERHLFRYGQAYLYLEKNELGSYMRDGKLRKVRVWHPSSVNPLYSEVDGLVGFERKTSSKTTKYSVEDVIHLWLPNADTEVGPGTPESTAALYAAGVLHNIDRYAEGYFGSGALNPTVLATEGDMFESDKERLQSWFQRQLTGIKNAFKVTVVGRKITPISLGYALKDLATVELTNSKREDVATATGVPHSLLFSNAANFATAEMDTLNFYDMSIKPRLKLILSILNERLFNPLGYHLAAHPERLEIYQKLQAESAGAVTTLTAGGIMTIDEARGYVNLPPLPKSDTPEATDATPIKGRGEVFAYHIEQGVVSKNEAREMLGFAPIADDEGSRLRELNGKLTVMQAAVNARIPVEVAAQMVGLELPKLPDTQPVVETPPRAENTPAAMDTPDDVENAKSAPLCACGKHSSADACLADELKKWETKARKRITEGKPHKATEFDSDVIPLALKAAIAGALDAVQSVDDVGSVFNHALVWGSYP